MSLRKRGTDQERREDTYLCVSIRPFPILPLFVLNCNLLVQIGQRDKITVRGRKGHRISVQRRKGGSV